MTVNLEDRVVDLEVRLTHQESGLDNITQASIRQERALDEIMAQLEQIKIVLQQMGEPSAVVSDDNKPPPHY